MLSTPLKILPVSLEIIRRAVGFLGSLKMNTTVSKLVSALEGLNGGGRVRIKGEKNLKFSNDVFLLENGTS